MSECYLMYHLLYAKEEACSKQEVNPLEYFLLCFNTSPLTCPIDARHLQGRFVRGGESSDYDGAIN